MKSSKIIIIAVIFFTLSVLSAYFRGWAEEPNVPVRFSAQEVEYTKEKTIARGKVTAIYQGVKIEADRVEVDNKSEILTATGHCAFTQGKNRLTGEVLTYDLKTQRAVLWNAYGTAKDIVYQEKPIQGTIFFWGKQIEWNGTSFKILNGEATTCDIPAPYYHYHIDSKEIEIFPQDKLIARKNSVYLGDKKLLGLKTIVVSLRPRDPRQRQQNLIPRVGYNDIDGWFAKEAVSYLWGKKDYGVVHVDWFERSGIGAGIEHYYRLGDRGEGSFYVYKLNPKTTGIRRREFNNRLQYLLPGNFNFSWAVDSSINDIPGFFRPPIYNSQVALNRTGPRHSISASYSLYNQGDNTNEGYNFLHTYKISNSLSSFLSVDYSTNSSFFSRTFRTHYLGRLTNLGKIFDTDLEQEVTSGTTLYFVNREPEITFRTHPLTVWNVPYIASLSLANYHEEPTGISTQRQDFQFLFPDKLWQLGKNNKLNVGAGFRQLMYGSGEAKYVLASRAGVLTRYGPHLNTRFDYNYQQPYGFSPIQYDFIGTYELLTGSLELYNKEYFRLGATTGYDIRSHFFQNLVTQVKWKPKKDWDITLSSNYDMNRSKWLNINSQLNLQLNPTLNLQYWSYYDLNTQKFIYQDFALVKDMHCWEARLIYRGNFQEFWLQIVLKAFPSESAVIGVNPRGPIIPQNWWDPSGSNIQYQQQYLR